MRYLLDANAVIALLNDTTTLVTHNTTEFQRVSGLRVEDWKGTTSPAALKPEKASAKPRSE